MSARTAPSSNAPPARPDADLGPPSGAEGAARAPRQPPAASPAPPLLGAAAHRGEGAPRIHLRVGTELRGPLASALLARGMQPVLSARKITGLALEIREFGVGMTDDPQREDRPRDGATGHVGRAMSPPLLALLPPALPGDRTDWRERALRAGALSLVTLTSSAADGPAIARLAARLTRDAEAAAHQGAERAWPRDGGERHADPPSAAGGHPAEPGGSATATCEPELTAALDDAVAQARRHGSVGALLMIELNRRVGIDTALGGAARQRVLETIEARLTDVLYRDGNRHRLRPAPELYRHGGGFALVWPQLSHGDQARQLAGMLLDQIAQPMQVAGAAFSLSANAGIGLLPHDGTSASRLIEAASRALHLAQQHGPGHSRFHAEDIAPPTRDHLRLEARLRRCVAEGRFALHYQPQVDLQTGALTGAEALLRWPDAVTGVTVAPAVFLPLAEATGLIVPLGHWVLRRVCQQIRQWLDRGLDVPRIAINVSALQMRQPDFATQVLEALAEAGLAGRHLGIELTEAALGGDHTAPTAADGTPLRARLQTLRDAGVQLSIEGFGIGGASLAALGRWPVDQLKIDGSFVADLDGGGAIICTAIVGLAHALGLRVVAEGIETDAQLNTLRELGCDEFQGHVLAPALGPTIMGEVLAGATLQHRVPAVARGPAAAPVSRPRLLRTHAPARPRQPDMSPIA